MLRVVVHAQDSARGVIPELRALAHIPMVARAALFDLGRTCTINHQMLDGRARAHGDGTPMEEIRRLGNQMAECIPIHPKDHFQVFC